MHDYVATSVVWRCFLLQVAVRAHCVVEEKLSWTFMFWTYVCTSVDTSAHLCTLIFHVKNCKNPCICKLNLYHWRRCIMVFQIRMEYFKINKNLSDKYFGTISNKNCRGTERISRSFLNMDPGYIQICDCMRPKGSVINSNRNGDCFKFLNHREKAEKFYQETIVKITKTELESIHGGLCDFFYSMLQKKFRVSRQGEARNSETI